MFHCILSILSSSLSFTKLLSFKATNNFKSFACYFNLQYVALYFVPINMLFNVLSLDTYYQRLTMMCLLGLYHLLYLLLISDTSYHHCFAMIELCPYLLFYLSFYFNMSCLWWILCDFLRTMMRAQHKSVNLCYNGSQSCKTHSQKYLYEKYVNLS